MISPAVERKVNYKTKTSFVRFCSSGNLIKTLKNLPVIYFVDLVLSKLINDSSLYSVT